MDIKYLCVNHFVDSLLKCEHLFLDTFIVKSMTEIETQHHVIQIGSVLSMISVPG